MDDDMWKFGLSNSAKRSPLHSLSDDYIEIEDSDEDDDLKQELTCPFCFEDFDLVGLCCHIDDEHPTTHAKSGTCPVCAAKVGSMGMNMAGHVITKHEKDLKILHKKKLRIGESHSTLYILRKELQDKHFQYLHEGASCVTSSRDMSPDPLLSSFIYNQVQVDKSEIIEPSSSSEASLTEKHADDNTLVRNIQSSTLLDEDQEEKARKCEFVHGLLFSTIFDDNL